MSSDKKTVVSSSSKKLHNSGLEAGSLITQSVASLDAEQVAELRKRAAEEALRLEVKQREQNIDYVAGKKAAEDHIETFDNLDKRGKLNRQVVRSEINTGAGRMNIESKSGATCFVASTAFGDPNHPDVVYLRRFRDEWLSKRHLGRIFISFYWKLGPKLARMIEPSPRIKRMAKRMIQALVLHIKRAKYLS